MFIGRKGWFHLIMFVIEFKEGNIIYGHVCVIIMIIAEEDQATFKRNQVICEQNSHQILTESQLFLDMCTTCVSHAKTQHWQYSKNLVEIM
jgi:hypothetical protein